MPPSDVAILTRTDIAILTRLGDGFTTAQASDAIGWPFGPSALAKQLRQLGCTAEKGRPLHGRSVVTLWSLPPKQGCACRRRTGSCDRKLAAAICGASAALAEMARVAAEGSTGDASAFDNDVTCLLADALQLVIQVELPIMDAYNGCGRDHQESLEQLQAAIAKHLTDWAG